MQQAITSEAEARGRLREDGASQAEGRRRRRLTETQRKESRPQAGEAGEMSDLRQILEP